MEPELKVGSRVRIRSTSCYYDNSLCNVTGTVIQAYKSLPFVYYVKWDNGEKNSYTHDDLLAWPLEKTSQEEGLKFDNSKPDLTDIPLDAMWEMGKAFTYGQKKYGKSNYRKGMLASRQLAAAIRHIYQHLDGETIDPEGSEAMHLGHAMASIAMAIYTIKNHPDKDDRFQGDINKYKKGESSV